MGRLENSSKGATQGNLLCWMGSERIEILKQAIQFKQQIELCVLSSPEGQGEVSSKLRRLFKPSVECTVRSGALK